MYACSRDFNQNEQLKSKTNYSNCIQLTRASEAQGFLRSIPANTGNPVPSKYSRSTLSPKCKHHVLARY